MANFPYNITGGIDFTATIVYGSSNAYTKDITGQIGLDWVIAYGIGTIKDITGEITLTWALGYSTPTNVKNVTGEITLLWALSYSGGGSNTTKNITGEILLSWVIGYREGCPNWGTDQITPSTTSIRFRKTTC